MLTDNSPVETSSGIFVNAMTHDIIEDTPIRKIIMPVISALSFKICGRSLILMDS